MEENKDISNGVTEDTNIELTKKIENNVVSPTKTKGSKRIAIVLLVIGLLLVGVAGYKLFIEKPNSSEPVNNNTQEENNNQINKVIEISKKVKINNGILYINSKKVTDVEFRILDNDNVYDLGDLTLVSDCVSDCKNYFIDDDTNVVGTMGKIEGSTYNVLITPKYTDARVLVVDGKDIFVWSYNYNPQDASSVCGRARNEEISITEKYTYNGNKQFSGPATNNSNTVGNFLDTSDYQCN